MDSKNLPLQVGVKALLKNKQGKFLLLRRSPIKYPDSGLKWTIPGGRIELNMDLMENLKREVQEEVGLELVSAVKLVAAQDIIKPDKHVVRLTYVGEINGDPVIDAEHLEAKWFTADEIKAMDVSVLDSYFKKLIDSKIIDL